MYWCGPTTGTVRRSRSEPLNGEKARGKRENEVKEPERMWMSTTEIRESIIRPLLPFNLPYQIAAEKPVLDYFMLRHQNGDRSYICSL